MYIVKLDLSDLYHRVNRKFGQKLNFEFVLKALAEHGELGHIAAYGVQRANEASGFISCLQRLGIETFFKRPEVIRCGDREIKRANWDLGIGMDVVHDTERVEITGVILGTGSNTMVPLVHYVCRWRQIPCLIFGCGIGRELRAVSTDVIEITEDMLE